jgi:hypothetical protein
MFPEIRSFHVRNTTVTMECDWVSAILSWFSFFGWCASRHSVRAIVESPGKEIRVTVHPGHFCRAAKIEADVLTFWEEVRVTLWKAGVFVARNPLQTIWNCLWWYRCLVPFEEADSSASMPSERGVYQEWRKTKGKIKYPASSSEQVLSFAWQRFEFERYLGDCTSNRYGLHLVKLFFCAC